MLQALTPLAILGIIGIYFLMLIVVSWYTGRNADNASFFLAGRQSSWVMVAIGMVGSSLSGVTFISIPGVVGAGGLNMAFSYMQVVLGYLLGYAVIALVLLPLYYKLNLTSIYSFLEERIGWSAYKTGAAYFLLSRTIGSSFRLFLVSIVIQRFVMDSFGVPFWVTVSGTILLIWAYTFQGGIKTIIWTDTIQTVTMLAAVFLTIVAIGQALDTSLLGLVAKVQNSQYTQMFFFERGWADSNNFFKQFISGALITIVMTGLDQDMMQKNLTCRSLRDAQKNMFTFSIILVFANVMFLTLGALLYIYASNIGLEIPAKTDELYPMIALQHLSPITGVVFIIGLIAAAYSSADSALTALTTSFCVDFLNFNKRDTPEAEKKATRIKVHIGMSLVTLAVILFFNALNNDAVINMLFKAAGYTYGPLLGLFAFGIFTSLKVREWADFSGYRLAQALPAAFPKRINLVMLVCIAAPLISFWVDTNSKELLYGFEFGFLILAFNGLLTFVGLLAISYRDYAAQMASYDDDHHPAE